MNELEKLAYMIAEEFIVAFENLEYLLVEEDLELPATLPLSRGKSA